MMDVELEQNRVTTPAPRKKKEAPSLPPRPTEGQLYETLRLARNALFCNDLRTCAFHAFQVASIYANMSPAVQDVVSADLPGIPSPLGDWASAGFVVWVVDWIIRNEGKHPVYHLPETGDHCPRHSTLVHDR